MFESKGRSAAEDDSAVFAGVLERAQLAVPTAHDEYGIAADPHFVEIAGFRHMVNAARDDPRLRPNMLVFAFSEVLASVSVRE